MHVKPIAIALEQWLKAQGKFSGAKICTKQNKFGKYEITKWEVPGIAQPSYSEIEQIVSAFEESYTPSKSLADQIVELDARISALENK